jgi:hypothetical protein
MAVTYELSFYPVFPIIILNSFSAPVHLITSCLAEPTYVYIPQLLLR